jgi:transcriptional regulator with XRE-family HTH domain
MDTDTARRANIVLNIELFENLTRSMGCENDSHRARSLGIHRTTLARLRARTQTPSAELMYDLAEQLGVGVESLFPREKEAQS